jgi:uncharacterized phage-associated protein
VTRRELVLAALTPAKGANYSPVQVQKLLFLIDRQMPELVDGPRFQFSAYHYGPFDKVVYQEIEALAGEGLANIYHDGNSRAFSLTAEGQRMGEQLLATLNDNASSFIRRASEFVRRLSFTQLVSAVYKAFPEMRVNSVFRG